MTADELQQKIEQVEFDHRQANWDKNLGQYKSEHKCFCGLKFIIDDHNPVGLTVFGYLARHKAKIIVELIVAHTKAARIDELSHVQLDHGVYATQTFVNGQAMTIQERLAELEGSNKSNE